MKSDKEDLCPICGKDSLIWGSVEVEGGQLAYPADCQECGFDGLQWHELKFASWTYRNGEEVRPK